MAAKIIGLSPVTFVSEDSASLAKEYQIPLSALKVTNGALDASDWPPIKGGTLKAGDVTMVNTLLGDLLKRGVLTISST